MDEIQITDLSSRVLNAMRARNLKAKPITEFERYGLRRILLHFSEHEWIAYSKEAVWAFVLQERLRVKRYGEQQPENDSVDAYTDSYGVIHMQPVLISYNRNYADKIVRPENQFEIVGRVL